MVILLIIGFIIVLLYFTLYSKYILLQFTEKYTKNHLLNTIKQREFPIIEPSIKINTKTGELNTDRYTIPLLKPDALIQLDKIFDHWNLSNIQCQIATRFINQHSYSDNDDIIFGQDGNNCYKIYVDNDGGHLNCIELPSGKLKSYIKVNKSFALKYADILLDTPATIDNWQNVLAKYDNDKPTGFHIYLKNPVMAHQIYNDLPIDIAQDYVYWIGSNDTYLTLYTRHNVLWNIKSAVDYIWMMFNTR